MKNNFKNKINIAYAPDDNFVHLAIVSMVSLLENTNENLEIFILYSSLSNENITLISTLEKKYTNCKIQFIKVDEKEFNEFPISTWVSVQTWFRTKIAEMCSELNKVIYLDCDTLVINDIKELWEIDISKVLAAGVNDIKSVETNIKRLQMHTYDYFNARILYINCVKWRQENIFDKIKSYAKKNAEILTYSDQDVINKIIDMNKLKLHPKFNYLEPWRCNDYIEYKGKDYIDYLEAKQEPVIIHFTSIKPDKYDNLHSLKKIWWQYCLKSPVCKDVTKSFIEEYRHQPTSFEIKIKMLKRFILSKIMFGGKRQKYKIKYNEIKEVYRNYQLAKTINKTLIQILNNRNELDASEYKLLEELAKKDANKSKTVARVESNSLI